MCGIAGIINLDFRPLDFKALQQMSFAQKHRGPDDSGFIGFSFKEQNIRHLDLGSGQNQGNHHHGGIGFNRLSILDLSLNGHQPMISEDGKIAIAYNGETYNAFDFKSFLLSKGYTFRSQTDTEILLYLYQELGIAKMLDLINGMFAFSIVDLTLNTIFLARDHAGIKPLYYYKRDNTVLFASEIKAFLNHSDFIAKINEEHVAEYQTFNYCGYDRTLFDSVYRVPQGCYLEISARAETLVNYYQPPFHNDRSISAKVAEDELERVLKNTVKSQLISDVKVGCQLSGGIDSSLITTYAKQFFNADMDTFSIVLANKQLSEEQYIDQVIARVNPLAHKFQLTSDYFINNIICAAWHFDEPMLIPQIVGFKRLAEGASADVTVLLSGEGSDELMGGYRRFYNLSYRAKYGRLINLLKNSANANLDHEDFFLRDSTVIRYDKQRDYFNYTAPQQVLDQRKLLIPQDPDLLKRLRYYETRAWLSATLMMQDKMTMAHSIENRVPFTDKKMFDLIFSLPSAYFVNSRLSPSPYHRRAAANTKILLKKITKKYYSKEFVYRPKVGFNQPLSEYFHTPQLQAMVNELLLPGIKHRGIYDYQIFNNAWRAFTSGDNRPMSYLWNSISFELWAQLFIDRKITA